MKLSRLLKPSEFLKNVATLATGTTIAQAISILTAPILYRIYDKEDYGILGLYMAITGVVGVFSTMQYLQAILLEKKDEDAKKVLWLNRSINVIISIISAIIVFVFSNQIANLLNNKSIETWLFLIPISIFFSGQNQIFRVWANRKSEYKILSTNSILTAIIIPIVSISLGLSIKNETGLFLGLLTSHVIPPLIMLFALRKKENIGYDFFEINSIIQLGRKYISFPIYTLPSQFIYNFITRVPVFILNHYAGVAMVGIYNLCNRMLNLPISMLSSSISEVYRQKASKYFNEKGDLFTLFKQTLKYLSMIAIIPVIVILLFGPNLFAFVFGEEWRFSGAMAQVLIPMVSLSLVVSPVTFIFFLKEKQKEDFILHLLILLLTSLSLIIGFSLSENVLIPLALYSLSYSLIYLIYLYKSYKYSS